jgi:hypothetical protein
MADRCARETLQQCQRCRQARNQEEFGRGGRRHFARTCNICARQKRAYRRGCDGFVRTLYNSMRWRTRQKGLDDIGWPTPEAFGVWVAMQARECPSCGVTLRYSGGGGGGGGGGEDALLEQASPDRTIAGRAPGSGYSAHNVVMRCLFCQFTKGEATLAEFDAFCRTLYEGAPAPDHGPPAPGWDARAAHSDYPRLSSLWARTKVDEQGWLSPPTLGSMPLHACSERTCLFLISPDRRDSARAHNPANTFPATRGENMAKRHGTDASWRACVLHRIEKQHERYARAFRRPPAGLMRRRAQFRAGDGAGAPAAAAALAQPHQIAHCEAEGMVAAPPKASASASASVLGRWPAAMSLAPLADGASGVGVGLP